MPKRLADINGASLSAPDSLSAEVDNKRILENVARVAADKALRGVGTESFTCYMCGKLKKKSEFYSSSDTRCITGVGRVCKQCARGLLYEDVKKDGKPQEEDIYKVLRYLDYPWNYQIYSNAVLLMEQADHGCSNLLEAYTKSIPADQKEYTFADSDPFGDIGYRPRQDDGGEDLEDEEYEFNRRDVIKIVGYDPFAAYPIISDKPRLYAQLITLIDEETKNDGMKMGAAIQIVKKLNQAEVINNQIDWCINDTTNALKNISVVDKLATSSKKLMDVANALAKDNGISVNFNNNKSAGATTLSGKIKKLNEIGLRSAKINAFDIGTCEGMRQVAEISEAARHKRIGYDENIAAEIRDIKIELVEEAQRERDEYKELSRKLLLENKDLKDFLRKQNLIDGKGAVISDAP